jgi:WD40 repeat protein
MLELKAISAKERAMRGLLYGFAAVLFVLGAILPAQAEERPVLQLDTGGHMALINKVLFTPDGKQLVSAAVDKVIRVWDVATGKTLRTIRGEIAPGDVGKVFAISQSPDGKWLAAGGWTGGDEIRLYDFASGELKALLKGHENVVNTLAFSPDGAKLISGSADKTAMIWDVSALTAPRDVAKAARTILSPLHRLKGHKAQIYAAGFTPDGVRVVTGAYDNDLRLWRAADGQEIAVMKGHADKVHSLAVAHDGTIASGDRSGEIRLWNGKTGAFLRTLGTQESGVGALSFSPDGNTLLSTCGNGPPCASEPQIVWEVATGQRKFQPTHHNNVVFAAAISPDGRWAATGGGDNKEIYIWDLKTGNHRAAPDGTPLTLSGTGKTTWAAGFSADGKAIGWGSKWTHTDPGKIYGPLEFALALPLGSESLGIPQLLDETAAKSFRRAVAKQDGWSLSHRKGGAYGDDEAILDIKQGEHVAASIERGSADGYGHSSYTFTPDGQTIISGGSSRLIAYDRAGNKLGDFQGHEADVYAVAVSPDGKYLASGSSDQTVRLWDVKTRALLATLYRDADGEWVIWTPEGFFASSEKGAERVGWQINQGPDKEARYVSGAQLRKFFLRPDLVSEKIKGDPDGKVRDAAAEINIDDLLRGAIAPAVQILSPANGATLSEASVTVTARIADRGGGIGRIVSKLNGQAVGGLAYGVLALKDGLFTRSFDLATPESEIEIVAEDRSGRIQSLPAKIAVRTDPKAIAGIPNLYVLAVGADSYRDTRKKLKFAVKDAQTLAKAFGDAGTGIYRNSPLVKTLFDDEVTAAKLEAAFKELGAKVRATDVFVFYLAGHGKTVDANFHFLPPSMENFSDAAIKSQGFNPEKLSAWFAEIKALKSIWIFDACESGSAEKLFRRDATADDAAVKRLKQATGRTIFMAASEEQSALEGYRNHGLFTYALLEGLARAGSGERVQLFDISDYVQERVPELSRELAACEVTKAKDYCQKPVVDLGHAQNYPVLPRYPAILAMLEAGGTVFSTKPTHVVIAVAELFETANRGGVAKRQLQRGELVTLIKTENGWAYIAKGGKPLGYVEEEKLLQFKE